jgi:hypothetical protein
MLAPFASCSDWIEVKPKDKMVIEDYWQSASDVQSTLLACYRAMLEDAFMNSIILGGELRSDNVVEGGNDMSEEERLMYNANILPSNSLTKWECYYKVINYCNTVLDRAPAVVDIDPDYSKGMLNANIAEATAIRALCYFYLVRLYGDVPYITWPSMDDDQDFKIPQTNRDEILNNLVTDLIQAENTAARSWATSSLTKGRITKNAVRTLLADIYLWQNRYQECINMCDKVLAEELTYDEYLNLMQTQMPTGNELVLVSPKSRTITYSGSYTFNQLFSYGNSTESIFELQFDPENNRNNRVETLYGYPEKAQHLTAAPLAEWSDPNLNVTTFGETDLRGKDSYMSKDGGVYRIFKYVGSSRTDGAGTSSGSSFYSMKTASETPNWIIYRLPDVILMKAEALAELGGDDQLQQAISLCNRTYMRSNPSALEADSLSFLSYPSQAAVRNLVFLERQREFLFEGKRWFDIFRRIRREGASTQIVTSYIARKFTTNSGIVTSKLSVMDALYWPIHKDELLVNPTLKQNAYYQSVLEEQGE